MSKYRFWTPLELSKGGSDGEMKIAGIASTEDRDMDGQVLKPGGFDCSSLLKGGYINWHHGTTKNPGAIIGEPTAASIKKEGDKNVLYIEGILYKGNKMAESVYQLAKSLEANSSGRRLGFSIEGEATEFDPSDPTIVKAARIDNVAITHMPKNTGSVMNIMKGIVQDYDFLHNEEGGLAGTGLEERVLRLEKALSSSRGGIPINREDAINRVLQGVLNGELVRKANN